MYYKKIIDIELSNVTLLSNSYTYIKDRGLPLDPPLYILFNTECNEFQNKPIHEHEYVVIGQDDGSVFLINILGEEVFCLQHDSDTMLFVNSSIALFIDILNFYEVMVERDKTGPQIAMHEELRAYCKEKDPGSIEVEGSWWNSIIQSLLEEDLYY